MYTIPKSQLNEKKFYNHNRKITKMSSISSSIYFTLWIHEIYVGKKVNFFLLFKHFFTIDLYPVKQTKRAINLNWFKKKLASDGVCLLFAITTKRKTFDVPCTVPYEKQIWQLGVINTVYHHLVFRTRIHYINDQNYTC